MPNSGSTIRRIHQFCCDKYVYMWLSVAVFLWVCVHYNIYNWGMPLTDDQGRPLYHR